MRPEEYAAMVEEAGAEKAEPGAEHPTLEHIYLYLTRDFQGNDHGYRTQPHDRAGA
jgi:hypothetical protein